LHQNLAIFAATIPRFIGGNCTCRQWPRRHATHSNTAARLDFFRYPNALFRRIGDVRAIKLNALDYLLKPIDKNELFTAIDKAKGLHQPLQPRQIQEASAVARGKVPEVIAVSDQNGLSFIKMQQIVLLEAESSYTIIHLLNGQKHTISKSLHHFEELLDASHFFRAHKSYIINLKEVVQYLRGDAGEIILSNNMHISLSRSKKDEFLNLFSRV
jgi:two-component system, LytTR family, response regulator